MNIFWIYNILCQWSEAESALYQAFMCLISVLLGADDRENMVSYMLLMLRTRTFCYILFVHITAILKKEGSLFENLMSSTPM